MLNVALTGNIAAGKSTVLGLFRSWGATTIDLDVLAREVLEPGTPALAAVVKRFGSDLLLPGGALDRAKLRQRVMGDPALRNALNAIVHPEVLLRSTQLADEARRRGDAILVVDIPLLFEVLDPSAYDAVILVDAPEATRKKRLVDMRGISEAEADTLLAAQLPSTDKRAKSHIVIDNDGSRETLEARTGEAWHRIVDLARSAG